jgi:hypothetical protein
VFKIRESTKHGPPVHGPLVWTGSMDPSMDRVHAWTPSMGRIFPNFNIKNILIFKNILVVLQHTFVLSSKPHLHSSVFFILKRGLLTTYHDKSMHHMWIIIVLLTCKAGKWSQPMKLKKPLPVKCWNNKPLSLIVHLN